MGKGNVISVIVAITLVGLVLGLSSYNELASAGIVILPPPTGDFCDFDGVSQHWDKIIFKTDRKLINDSPPPLFPSKLLPNRTYDIKVMQDPLSVTVLEDTVAIFLRDNGYKTSVGKVFPRFISIVDVEYDIACTSIDADGDGFSPPEDCDDGDPLVNPSATEVCNTIDDNCNGVIDEGGVCGATDGGAMSNYLPLSINSLGFE